jgi:hypothetical protein
MSQSLPVSGCGSLGKKLWISQLFLFEYEGSTGYATREDKKPSIAGRLGRRVRSAQSPRGWGVSLAFCLAALSLGPRGD